MNSRNELSVASLAMAIIAGSASANVVFPNYDQTAISLTKVNGTQFQDTISISNSNFAVQHQVGPIGNPDRVSSRINMQTEQDGNNYWLNMKGFYETYGPASTAGSPADTMQQQWTIRGTYDVTTLSQYKLAFGVNANPDVDLVIPNYDGEIVFSFYLNNLHKTTKVFTAADPLGSNLWSSSGSPGQKSGTWQLDITFAGGTTGVLFPDSRFKAYFGYEESLGIPAPGAVALLGIGGLVARRRRS